MNGQIPVCRWFFISACLAMAAVPLPSAHGQGKREKGPALVATGKVVKQLTTSTQSFIGTLRPVRKSVIGSAVAGRVQQVLIEDGVAVGEDPDNQSDHFLGQPIVEILRETVEIEMDAAEIELALRRKSYEELQKSLPQEIELAKASVQQAQAQKDYAEQVFKRAQDLVDNRGISQSELEQGISQFRLQSQALIAAQSELQRLESTREIRLTIADMRIRAQEAEIRRLDDLRSKHTMRTPFSGFVTRKIVEQGDWVTAGSPVAEVVQLDPIELRVNVPQEYLKPLQESFDSATPDNKILATVTVDSLETTLPGRVERIVPQADERTRALPVVIRIDNPSTPSGYLLRPGLLASANLPIGNPKDALMVSKDALVLGQGRIELFVVTHASDGSATVRSVVVQTGPAAGELIEISGDVREGDTVVIQGNERLQNGQSVKIIEGGS